MVTASSKCSSTLLGIVPREILSLFLSLFPSQNSFSLSRCQLSIFFIVIYKSHRLVINHYTGNYHKRTKFLVKASFSITLSIMFVQAWREFHFLSFSFFFFFSSFLHNDMCTLVLWRTRKISVRLLRKTERRNGCVAKGDRETERGGRGQNWLDREIEIARKWTASRR